jgi:hypothetical protein
MTDNLHPWVRGDYLHMAEAVNFADRMKRSGVKIRCWRMTAAELDRLRAWTRRDDLFLGYPVVKR